jgi:hypothetical protein
MFRQLGAGFQVLDFGVRKLAAHNPLHCGQLWVLAFGLTTTVPTKEPNVKGCRGTTLDKENPESRLFY